MATKSVFEFQHDGADMEECAFRRGVVHGMVLAANGVRLGMGAGDLGFWVEVLQEWRNVYASGRDLSFRIPPGSGWDGVRRDS
jgi:hypothetical protein